MTYDLIGKNFTPPDVLGKVTGKAKYAEDFRADGMVFLKFIGSPMPHARVLGIDVSEALAMEGVVGVLTPEDVPAAQGVNEVILSDEPSYVGEPIVAIAAESEQIAADALDKVKIEYEALPFVVDPLDSLYPSGPNARVLGNVISWEVELQTLKWTAKDFASAGDDELPMTGKPAAEWSYGDVDGEFANAALVLDETFVTAANSHHSMEPRSAMAYWENGKCHLFGSSQSQSFNMPGLAQLLGVPPDQLVFVAEYCGGGFGSKGAPYSLMVLPAYMSKKVGRPVMMRVSRAEEYYNGSARAGFQGRIRMGFDKSGRLLAADLYLVQQGGPKLGFPDYESAAEAVSLVYQPKAMRFRSVPVITNTPPAGPQRGPGQNQIHMVVEPLLDAAARELGVDRVEIRRINAPGHDSRFGGKQGPITSSYLRDAYDLGAAAFDWETKKKLSGKRTGSKVIGVGVGQAWHSAGFNGFDGLVRITGDGKVHIHSGVGNLGTYSYAATSRVVAEVLRCSWENCVIERGDSSLGLPWNIGQFGSNTSFTMTRSNHAAAMDLKNKLLEIAAQVHGGGADDYDIGNETVFSKADPAKKLSYAEAAQKAIELGGKFSGQELPEDIFFVTQAAVAGIAGSGLIGVAKDNYPISGMVPALAVGYILIELDTETGKYEILEYHGTADCGTVIHPQSLATQIKGGAVMGFGMAGSEHMVYDPENGLPANVTLYQAKPASYLDVPAVMGWAAVDKPDPDSPIGSKGVGEPTMGCAGAALLCAISDALGGTVFNRTPVMADMIVNAAAGRPQSHKKLQVNTF
jgi:xanthine dehydrogenase molybdenum-binding subunit